MHVQCAICRFGSGAGMGLSRAESLASKLLGLQCCNVPTSNFQHLTSICLGASETRSPSLIAFSRLILLMDMSSRALGHPPELPLLGFASRSGVLFWGSRLILLMDMSSPWSPARTAIARICQSEWGFVLGIKVDTSDGHVKPLVTRQNCHC